MSEVILPNLPALQPGAKQKLIAIADVYAKGHKENVLHYLETGEVTFEELPLLNNVPEIKNWLEEQYNAWRYPVDPAEQEAQKELEGALPASAEGVDNLSIVELESLKSLLQKYLDAYSTTLPTGNIVSKAKEYLDRIEMNEQKVREKNEWERVDSLNYAELMRYYTNHPSTPFYNELADAIWDLIKVPPIDLSKINDFMTNFPRSEYYKQAQEIVSEHEEWQLVSTAGDLTDVHDYIQKHDGGVFYKEALNLLEELKKTELEKYQANPASIELESFEEYIRKGLYSEDDFIATGVATRKAIDMARYRRNHINEFVIDETQVVKSCPAGATDVYMFGIPSTGKTSVLMGLLSSTNILYDPVRFGGDYACKLTDLCNRGAMPPKMTAPDFVTLVSATINDSKANGVQHNINLIDMPGEDFYKKMALIKDDNDQAIVSFADMGSTTKFANNYVPEMLQNDNEKIFFIVVDPTADDIRIRRKEGNELRTYIVRQSICLSKFISMLNQPENEQIMNKVRAIHLIVTKSDTLGGMASERTTRTRELLNDRIYLQSIKGLKQVCEKYDINGITGNRPRAFNFSLGTFYMGGEIFDYNPNDSDNLLKAISMISSGTRTKKTLAERIQIWFNE